jgi:hypothetical protein
MSSLSNKGLRWIAAGVVAIGSVSAFGLTAASAKSPAAGPQVATLAESHAVPASAKLTSAKHKTAKHAASKRTVKTASRKHAARKPAKHTARHAKHTAAKGKHKAAGKSHKPSATR